MLLMQHLPGTGADWQKSVLLQDVTQADFQLPTFGTKLLRFRDECINGRGFVLLQGLPVERWSVQETAVAYWGIGTYWGTAQSQNRLHHLLGHVKVRTLFAEWV